MSIRQQKVAKREGILLGFAYGMGLTASVVLIAIWIGIYLDYSF